MDHRNNADAIDIHTRTYRSLLKSPGVITVKTLIDSHMEMRSILHEKAEEVEIDTSAFIYSLLRLPSCMSLVKKIILGQSVSVFNTHGYREIKNWKEVNSPGRRRKMYFNGKDTLAVYIGSVSDVDDLITLLTAFQIEWNKLHVSFINESDTGKGISKLINNEDLSKIKNIWGENFTSFLTAIKYREIDFTVHLLSGSFMEYMKSTQHWWNQISFRLKNYKFINHPIYFISSNRHSMINLVSRFVLHEEKNLIDYLYKNESSVLVNLWENIKKGDKSITKEYFLYYLAKKALKKDRKMTARKSLLEKKLGIVNIPAKYFLDIDAQLIPIHALTRSPLSSILGMNLNKLSKSNALIVNIDYPLGWAAYQVLTEIGQNAEKIKGIYIMGKAATLNGQIGDIIIPNQIFDVHTKNTYAINNIFSKKDFEGKFLSGQILDKQKAVSTKGTFLESKKMIENWFKSGYTDIEMEAGPYMNGVYEFVYYNRYEENQFINLNDTPFDLGIIHYASDTPYSKAKNLGVRNLSYEGVEPTYAISLEILRKIVVRELEEIS